MWAHDVLHAPRGLRDRQRPLVPGERVAQHVLHRGVQEVHRALDEVHGRDPAAGVPPDHVVALLLPPALELRVRVIRRLHVLDVRVVADHEPGLVVPHVHDELRRLRHQPEDRAPLVHAQEALAVLGGDGGLEVGLDSVH